MSVGVMKDYKLKIVDVQMMLKNTVRDPCDDIAMPTIDLSLHFFLF
jgi:hypothetical protein